MLGATTPRPAERFTAASLASWAPRTRVNAGVGAAAGVGAIAAGLGRSALIVTDQTLSGTGAVADARMACTLARMSCEIFDGVAPDPSLAAALAAAQAIRAARAQVVIAVGGGSVLDVAKTAALLARNQDVFERLDWCGGFARVEAQTFARPPLATVMLPTTYGTGAEVNSVACLSRVPGGEKLLLIDPALQPAFALIDPRLSRTLPRDMCLGGAFETFVRLLVPYLTDPAQRPVQDSIALALMRTLVEQGSRIAAGVGAGEDSARLALALATVASHVAWANTGRPPGGHALWYLGNTLSPAAGINKVTGLAMLTPAYLDAVAGDAHPRLGSARRLATVGAEVFGCDASPADARAAIVDLITAWEMPTSTAALGNQTPNPAVLANRAAALWGDPELLGDVPQAALIDIYSAASVAPESHQEEYL